MPDHRSSRHAPPRLLRRETAGWLLLLLTVADATVTYLMLRARSARELNPLVRWLWEQGDLPFLVARISLTTAAVLWLMRGGGHPHVRLGLLVGFAICLPINLLHLLNSLVLLTARAG
jgi:hypothetical protein